MSDQITWTSLLKKYKDNHIQYILKNNIKLSEQLLSGTFAAFFAILTSEFTTLPGDVYIYYFILIFLFITKFSDDSNETSDFSFPTTLSVGMSIITVSIISGIYILIVYTGHLGIIEATIDLIITTLYVITILPIYSMIMTLTGSFIKDLVSKIFQYASKIQ